MLVQRRVMTWERVGKSLQSLVAHGLLFSFTLLLALKIDRVVPCSGIIFSPLWLFHAFVARGRFSLPAPSMPYDRHWAPCHAIIATPLLVAFEQPLCIHLESPYAVNLKIVFLPLLPFEVAILIDNIRYSTFSPDMVKKMPREVLAKEVCRLQAALNEQTRVTKSSLQEYEKLQNEKILCRVCFEKQINVVLLPCRHYIIRATCCEKCMRCPDCRVTIENGMPLSYS